MHVTFVHATNESPTIRTFFFRPIKPVHFTAGQFIELTLPHDTPDGRGIRRWFTLSSAPNEELISITTRVVRDCSSFKQTLSNLKPGDIVTMSEPMGDFVLPQDPTIPLVFVAGGIGITPFHSILRWLVIGQESRPIHFLYAVHDEDDIIFQHTFHEYGITPTIIVANPSDAWGGERGKLTADHVVKLAPIQENGLVYIAGPEQMAESLTNDLLAKDISKTQLVTDFFPGYLSA